MRSGKLYILRNHEKEWLILYQLTSKGQDKALVVAERKIEKKDHVTILPWGRVSIFLNSPVFNGACAYIAPEVYVSNFLARKNGGIGLLDLYGIVSPLIPSKKEKVRLCKSVIMANN